MRCGADSAMAEYAVIDLGSIMPPGIIDLALYYVGFNIEISVISVSEFRFRRGKTH